MFLQVQHDIQAKILCKTAVGRVKLGCGLMEEVRVSVIVRGVLE